MSKASNSSFINLTGRSQTPFETAYFVLKFRKGTFVNLVVFEVN